MTAITIDEILELVESHALAQTLGVRAYCTLDEPGERSEGTAAKISARFIPLGFSQTAGAGALSPVGYFAIELKAHSNAFMQAGEYGDFLALGEEIAYRLHRKRFGSKSVFFSKNILVTSSFVLQNNSRRLQVKLEEGEAAQYLFFWTSDLTVETIDSASGTASGSGHSTLGVESPEAAAIREDVTNQIAQANELFS